jgi:hypothetical protein
VTSTTVNPSAPTQLLPSVGNVAYATPALVALPQSVTAMNTVAGVTAAFVTVTESVAPSTRPLVAVAEMPFTAARAGVAAYV